MSYYQLEKNLLNQSNVEKKSVVLHTASDPFSNFFFFSFSARLIFGYTSLPEIFIGQIAVLNEQMGET